MKLRNQFFLGYAVIFALMIIVTTLTHQSIVSSTKAVALVDRAQEIMTNVRLLMRLMVDMETGVRGYALTGKVEFLEPYNAGNSDFDMNMVLLKDIETNAEQKARLFEIEAVVRRWQKEVALPIIAAKKESARGNSAVGMEKAIALVEMGNRINIMGSIRAGIAKFVDIEKGILLERQKISEEALDRCKLTLILGTLLAIFFGVGAVFFTSRAVLRKVGGEPADIAAMADEIAKGNLNLKIDDNPNGSSGIRASIETMAHSLKINKEKVESQDWLKTGIARLNDIMRGDPDIERLTVKVISEITTYIDAQIGAFYLAYNGATLSLMASYAYTKRKNLSNVFNTGEGLVGQAALEKRQILIKNVPEDYIKVTSGLGERIPRYICVTPFLYEDRVKGVIEIGTLNEITDLQLEYLALAMPALAIAVESAEQRTNLSRSLEESQRLSQELRVQQEELQTTNEELEEQTQRIKASEERLKTQQEELQVTNEELEEKNDLLERQKKEVEIARKVIEEKAEELALASKYKSEFLANMSHELRTPLNSLLLLAQSLSENKTGNLTQDQIESSGIIYKSGSDLLNLINEILDLSKIEAGRMDLQMSTVQIDDLSESIRLFFQHMAKEKNLNLQVIVDEVSPPRISTDRKRLEQIMRNLISNAIKFTESGGVSITFGRPAAGVNLSKSRLSAQECMAITVKDTGIGIAPEHQKVIFEAFQQVDGGTARRYGGTGLGLSISRELAILLGGEIQVKSESGKGSTFTLYLPIERGAQNAERGFAEKKTGRRSGIPSDLHGADSTLKTIPDDRDSLSKGDKIILVIEDDPNFARILFQKCHEKGFRCLVAPSGEIGLELAGIHLPNAVILDIRLPGMDGWSVLNSLKEDTRTRHIPVHIISVEEATTEAISKGAVGHATKPIDRETLDQTFRKIEELTVGRSKRLLVVEDDPDIRHRTVKLIGNGDVTVDEADTGKKAMEAIRSNQYDCVVLDLGLPDMSGRDLLKKLESEGIQLPPIIVHTARNLTIEEEADLREQAESIVIKDVRSQERLLDEVSLFLHRIVGKMAENKRQIIIDLHDTDTLLRDKKILIVDDDMRTTFALSRLLSERGMKTFKAENGEKALKILEEQPDLDLVLMDIMMPVMDGYEAIQKIRNTEGRSQNIPIIALTAKAMKEDREKCIALGASDYLPKPVDQGRLISMMRVWLYR
jgi:CheY-like chemotaxis protein/signal transduction histidine kinase/CHASE3 domain sensor protein